MAAKALALEEITAKKIMAKKKRKRHQKK